MQFFEPVMGLAKGFWMPEGQKMAILHSFSTGNGQNQQPQVSFHRRELEVILPLYGQMVAAGEWRDYGISMLKDVAIFSVFRHAAEHPIYRIEKRPALAGRQGQYSVIGMDGRILKRGADLRQVLTVLEKKLIRAVGD